MKKLSVIFVAVLLLCLLLPGCQSEQETSSSTQGTTESTNSSSTDSTVATHNLDIGAVLEEYENIMHFWVYSSDGRLVTQFDGSVKAVRYEDPKTKNQTQESYYLNLALSFQTEDFRFLPEQDPNLTFPCYDHVDFYTSEIKMYDVDTGFFGSHNAALDMENGRLLVLLESVQGEQYVLVAAQDESADPNEVLSFFEAYITDEWPAWWEQYNGSL